MAAETQAWDQANSVVWCDVVGEARWGGIRGFDGSWLCWRSGPDVAERGEFTTCNDLLSELSERWPTEAVAVAVYADAEGHRFLGKEATIQLITRARAQRLSVGDDMLVNDTVLTWDGTALQSANVGRAGESTGWPDGWTSGHIRHWKTSGGTAEQAAALGNAGWTRNEMMATASAVEDLAAAPTLVSSAESCRLHNDALKDLVAGRWPEVPAGAVLSVKCECSSGLRSRTSIAKDDQHWTVQTFSRSQDKTWTHQTETLSSEDVEGAIREGSSLFALEVGVIKSFSIDPSQLDQATFIDALHFPTSASESEAGWSVEEAALWAAEDDDLAGSFPDVAWVPRWAEVASRQPSGSTSRLRITGVCPSSETNRVMPILFEELQPFGVRRLAEASWFMDSQGPPSSNGGNALLDSGTGLLIDWQWGDFGNEVDIMLFPPTVEGAVSALVAWSDDDRVNVSLSGALGGTSADGVLVSDPPSEDDSQFEDPNEYYPGEVSVSLDLSEEEAEALRRQLSQ